MAWLNFNDSLNNLKGQISNFANNVLADEEEGGDGEPKYEELKQLCAQQELDIERLKQVNNELTNKLKAQNGIDTIDTWSWNSTDDKSTDQHQSDISNLKRTVTQLENEKQVLIKQLEQLDSDNQENLLKVITLRNRLQEELADMKQKYSQLENENTVAIQNEDKLREEVAKLQEKLLSTQQLSDHDSLEVIKEKNNTFLVDNQKTRVELEEAQKELGVLKSSSDTLQKVFEDYKYATEKECAENMETIKKLEAENEIVCGELQKARDRIKLFEQKSLEDEDNCRKLAVILDTYEKEVSFLKTNVHDLQTQNEVLVRNAGDQQIDRTLEQELEQIQSSHQMQLKMLQDELDSLKLQEAQNDIDSDKLQDLQSNNERLKEEIDILQDEIKNIQSEKKGLEKIFTDVEKQYSLEKETFVQEITTLKEERDDLILQNNNIKREFYEKDVTDSCTNPQETWSDLCKINEKLNEENSTLKTAIAHLEEVNKNQDLTRDTTQKQYESKLKEWHNKYVRIVTQNIKHFQDPSESSDIQEVTDSDDNNVSEFSKQVQIISKILFELRSKCEVLEKKVFDLTEEKNKILAEKNHEIEKLIQNSEVLSQEVLNKAQLVKEYENEMNELAKNNELLINELEIYKNNPGLQTISESNEDNMVLLEAQLETANKRIEDLESVIDDLERVKDAYGDESKDVSLLVTQLENANKRIEDLEKIIDDLENQHNDRSKHEIHDSRSQRTIAEEMAFEKDQQHDNLENNYKHLQEETDISKVNMKNVEKYLEDFDELKINFEKLKAEYENMEYQLSEYKINSETTREENEQLKLKIDMLLENSNKAEKLYEENSKLIEYLRREISTAKNKLIAEEDSSKNLDLQVRTLTEKLQNAKMTETSLKLQYDTVCKELSVAADVNQTLELSLNKVNEDLGQFQRNFVDLQSQYDKIYFENDDLKNTVMNKEYLISELQAKLEQFENIAVEENSDLLKKLTISDSDANAINHLKNSLEKFENIILDESQQKLEILSLEETDEKPVMEVDINEYNELKTDYEKLVEEKAKIEQELLKLPSLQEQLVDTSQKCAVLQQQLQEITNSRNELITMVTTKHQENVAYHNEIQRLTQILNMEAEKCRNYEIQLNQLNDMVSKADLEQKDLEIEKISEQNSFLKEKCEVMAKNLLEEQAKVEQLLSERSSPSEKEITLQKNLDRLQAHLIELEEHYTQELLNSEHKITELQSKMVELEEREKSSSNMYTSVSIRANQQVESLQSQLQTVINERDSLRKQISDAEDNNNKQGAALGNLQFVLEQFRRDKEKDVQKETERIRRQINVEKQVQEELKKEITQLKSQLEESNQGLLAASRISDQLEISKKTIATLKDEVSHLQTKLMKKEEEIKDIASQTDGKVDKSLIKNLIIGFISSNAIKMTKDQMQILKIIATVLDFSQQDHNKVNLNTQQQASWLSNLLAPQPGNESMTQESLSQAFIKFLENESKPRVIPNLLNSEAESAKPASTNTSSTSKQSPIVLNEIVLPTFADFGQSRNSSSILKDVLKDSS